jgi:hypothetical protein
MLRAAIWLSEALPDAVAGAAQVVHFWAIPQQSAASVNSYGFLMLFFMLKNSSR